MRGLRGVLAAALAVAVTTSACGVVAGEKTETRSVVTVLAAASLTEAFTTIGADFTAAHPGVRVNFSFAGSSQLAQQIRAGAPADVFAAANPATMATAVDNGDQPRVFARNELVIAVAKGNPKGIEELRDLTEPKIKVALCAAQVPCGAAATKVLTAAGVEFTPVTLEQDVKGALAKVRLGEVDAALVYRTDALAASDEVDGIEFAESAAAINEYPIVTLSSASNPTGGEGFVAYVLSEPGRRALTAAGLQLP